MKSWSCCGGREQVHRMVVRRTVKAQGAGGVVEGLEEAEQAHGGSGLGVEEAICEVEG